MYKVSRANKGKERGDIGIKISSSVLSHSVFVSLTLSLSLTHTHTNTYTQAHFEKKKRNLKS